MAQSFGINLYCSSSEVALITLDQISILYDKDYSASSTLTNSTIADDDTFLVQDGTSWSTTSMKRISFNNLYRGMAGSSTFTTALFADTALTGNATIFGVTNGDHIALQVLNNQSPADTDDSVSIRFSPDSAQQNAARIRVGKDADFSDASNTSAHMAFHTTNANTSGERMRISSAGKVGIGTNNPQADLHVDGQVRVDGTAYFDAAQTGAVDSSGGSASINLNWLIGNKYHLTVTGTSSTVNFSNNPAGPCNLVIKVIQGDGNDTITWSATSGSIKWPNSTAPTLSTGNGDIDIISFYFDGTNYFGAIAKDFG